VPLVKELRGDIVVPIAVPFMPAASGNAGGSGYTLPFNATIKSATLVWSAAITGAATNNFAVAFFNRGAAGAGTVAWATAITYGNGTNATKANPVTLTLSSTASDLQPSAGDVLNVELSTNGTGLLCPGGVVMVTLQVR
jgi:hypothetical protein